MGMPGQTAVNISEPGHAETGEGPGSSISASEMPEQAAPRAPPAHCIASGAVAVKEGSPASSGSTDELLVLNKQACEGLTHQLYIAWAAWAAWSRHRK